MICPKCQTDNPAEASFCMKCGSALATACPECATELPSEAQFCFKCGHRMGEPQAEAEKEPEPAQSRIEQYIPAELLNKLESARAGGGMQGERRVVTMLFCDVEGSTAAAEGLDPEEWAEIMNGAFEHLISPVYRYEGTLARLMGDAILAFFGAPIGHEDDPQRAVLAGLDIVEAIRPYREQVKSEWGLDFNVRVGINTGLVVVGEVGSDLRVEYTALGDAVNLAARMEQTAAPGTVQITEDTYRHVAPLFEMEELGGIEVKGKSQPVTAYRAIGAKETPGSLRGIAGLEAPLIGRDAEMGMLRDAVSEVQSGRGQLVSVMGEAGLGKSRLVAELRNALASDGLVSVNGTSPGSAGGPAITWYEGRSLSYETASPYAPFSVLLSECFGLGQESTDEERYRRVEDGVRALMQQSVEETAAFIATMLGIELPPDAQDRVRYLEPPQIRGQVFKATANYVEHLAKSKPTMLVFEDLHWIDPTSLELLHELMPLTDRVPLSIVGIFRPWRQEPSWQFHEAASRDFSHRYTAVQLQPLDGDSSRELVANLLHVEDLPESVRALILAKAEGNPFFVEEVIRSLLDAGLVIRVDDHWQATKEIEDIAVPDTLTGVITARLDRLDDRSKRVAQTASVIGREFRFDALADVSGPMEGLDGAIADLQRRELIREKSVVPDRVYAFQHALTQETAYDSLLRSTRRELHRSVAEQMERQEPERVNDIARHFLEAREEKRALPYLVEAGDRAARSYATQEAIQSYRRALEILEPADDLSLARRVYEGLGGALTFAYDVPAAVENYHTMAHIAEEYDDAPMQVSALNKLGFVTALMRGEFPEAESHLFDAERLAKESDDLAGLAEMHMTYCYIKTTNGEFESAADHLSEAAQIGRDLDVEEVELFGLTHSANTQVYMTNFDTAWEMAQKAKAAAEEAGNKKYLSEVMALTLPMIYMRNGDLEAAQRSAAEGAELATSIGAFDQAACGEYFLGQVAWAQGEYERTIASAERALDYARSAGTPYLQASAFCALGMAYLDISESLEDRVTEYHNKALEVIETPLGSAMGAMNWADIGFCAMTLGNLERAGDYFEKGLSTPTSLIHMMRPRLLVGKAFLKMFQGQAEEASGLIEGAASLVDAGQMMHFQPMISFARGNLSSAQDDPEAALEHFARAEEMAAGAQMRPLVWQTRAQAASVLAAMGRDEDALAKARQARDMVEEIAALFEDETFARLFRESAARKLPELEFAQ